VPGDHGGYLFGEKVIFDGGKHIILLQELDRVSEFSFGLYHRVKILGKRVLQGKKLRNAFPAPVLAPNPRAEILHMVLLSQQLCRHEDPFLQGGEDVKQQQEVSFESCQSTTYQGKFQFLEMALSLLCLSQQNFPPKTIL